MVFVFPPVTSYHRFLIHQAVEEYPQLASFSIGEGDERRTVLCSKDLRVGIPSQAPNSLKRSLETTESSADSRGSPKSCREEVEDTKDTTSWGLFGREWRDVRFSEAPGKMDSSQDVVSLEGNPAKPLEEIPSKAKSKDKNRKTKRAPQELYVPRGQRQNTPTGESTASQQPATQVVEKPQGVQEERSAPPGGKQQHREQRKGREGGKGKSQRDRKISAEGENSEVGEHKGQNKGKHGRKPRRENVKWTKNLESKAPVGSENTNTSGIDTNSPNNAPGKPTLPKSAAKTVKTASPVPEDWNEIDCDERDVTCHPTGTRLTSRGKLIPVEPSDDTIEPRETVTGVTDRTGDNVEGEHDVETVLQSNRTESKVDFPAELVSEDCTTRTRSDSDEDKSETKLQSTDTSIQSNTLQDNVSLENTSTERTVCKDGKTTASPESVQISENISTSASENSSVSSTTDKTSPENVEPDREMDLSVTTTVEAVSSQNPDQEHKQENPTEAMQSLKVVDEQENCPTSCETIPCGTDEVNETEILESEKPILDSVEPDHERCEKMEKDESSAAVKTEDATRKEESVRAADSDEGADGDDDWDALFDDSGDCLKPEELQELSEGVGNVQVSVKQSKRDYYHYQPKDNTNYSELEHVIEVYDFPADFKTQDLVTGFSNMKTKEMDIKWIDDTHALAIFPSSIIAQDAISLSNPMFRTRPLMLASREAKMKARACEEFLLPSKPRPETSAATARRLVSGALGLKTNVPKEQRAAERQKIKDAKDRRRNDKKQQEDIWTGNI